MSKCAKALSVLAILGFLSVTASADLEYWLPFEDGGGNPSLVNYGLAGGSAADYTGWGCGTGTASATTNAAVGSYAETISGNALSLDASAVPTLTTVGQSITVAAWIYLPDITGTHGIATVTRSDSSGWSFCTSTDNGPGTVEARFINPSTGLWSWEVSSLHVVPNTWTFVAMTWTVGSNVSMYEYTLGTGGAVWTSSDLMAPVGPAAGWPLLVGEKSSGYQNWLNGSMDDFRLYDTALGLSDIKALVPAAPITWTGAGGNSNWGTANNWSNWGSLPATTDTVNFTLAGGATVTMDAPQTVGGANVTGAGNWRFGNAYDRWTTPPTTNGLTVTNGFTFGGTGVSDVYAFLTGNMSVTVNSGIVRLSDYSNNFVGGVYVNGGYLTTDLRWMGANGFFGGAGNTIYVGSTSAGNTDATFAPQIGDGTAFSLPIVIQAGNSGKAILTYNPVDGPNTGGVSGTGIWLGQQWPTFTYSSTITLNKDVTLGNNAISRDLGAYQMYVSGPISGTGGVDTQGQSWMYVTGANSYNGTTQVNGGSQAFFTNSGSTFTGPIDVNCGVLYADNNGALGNTSNVVTLGSAHGIGGLGADSSNNLVLPASRSINLVGNGYLSSKGDGLEIQGAIGGSGRLIVGMTSVSGASYYWYTIKLDANNTYSGGTTVVAGLVGDISGYSWTVPVNPFDAYYANDFFGTGDVTIKFGGAVRATAATNFGATAKVFVNDEGFGGGLVMGGDFMPNIDPSSSGTLLWDQNRGQTGAFVTALGDATHPIGNGYMYLGDAASGGYEPFPDTYSGAGSFPTSFAALVANQTPAADGSKTYFIGNSWGVFQTWDGGTTGFNDFLQADGVTNQVMNVQDGKPGLWGEGVGNYMWCGDNSEFSGSLTIAPESVWLQFTNKDMGSATGAVYLNGNCNGNWGMACTLYVDNYARSTSGTLTKGDVYFNGSSIILLNRNGDNTRSAIFAANSYNRQYRGTLGFQSLNSDLDGTETATIKAGGTAPTVTNNMVAPYFWDAQGNNFVTYGAGGFAPVSVTVGSLAGSTSSQIVYTAGEAVSGPVSAYALRTSGALTGSGTVTVGDGVNPAGVIFAVAATHTANFAFGGSEGIIYTPDTSANTVIGGTISGSNGITKSGAGALELTGTNSGLSGDITLNQGTFVYGNDSELGSSRIVLNGGTVALGHASQVGAQVTTNATIAVGPNGGTIGASFWSNGNITRPHFAGNIVDLDPAHPGMLNLGGNWGLYIEGTANTYSGGTYIYGMQGVTVAANSSLGTGDVILNGGYGYFEGNASEVYFEGDHNTSTTARLYLQMDSSLAIFQSANPQIGSLEGVGYAELGNNNASPTVLTTGLNNLNTDFYGRIQDFSNAYSPSNGLIKAGYGTFTLWGVCTYTGTTTVSNGTLVNNNLISGPVSVGTVVEGSGHGASAQTPIYSGSGTTVGLTTVNPGGQVTGSGYFQGGLQVNGGSVNVSGALVGGQGVTVVSGSYSGSSTITPASGFPSGLIVDAAGTFGGTHTINGPSVSSGAVSGASTFNGTVTVSGGTFTGTNAVNGDYTQNGGALDGANTFGAVGSPVAVAVNGGTFGGINTIVGNVQVGDYNGNGSTPVISGTSNITGNVTVGLNGTLDGNHTIHGSLTTAAGGNAVVSPHNGAPAGTLAVIGNVTLDSSTTLNFNLAGSGTSGGGINDLIAITGDLSLDGTLNVTALTDFGVGTYTLLTYTGLLTGPGLTQGTMPTGGYTYTIDASAGHVNLDVVTPWQPGDTNRDGAVNSLDIDAILRHFGAPADSQWKVDASGTPVDQGDVTFELHTYFHTNYADANLDRKTDFVDFQVLLDHWQASGPSIGWAQGDFDGSGTVDFLDFQKLLDYWNPGGWSFAPAQAPEPATLSLLILGGLALLRRKK